MALSCCRSIFFSFFFLPWAMDSTFPKTLSVIIGEQRMTFHLSLWRSALFHSFVPCPFCFILDWNYNYVLMLHIVMEMIESQMRNLRPIAVTLTCGEVWVMRLTLQGQRRSGAQKAPTWAWTVKETSTENPMSVWLLRNLLISYFVLRRIISDLWNIFNRRKLKVSKP